MRYIDYEIFGNVKRISFCDDYCCTGYPADSGECTGRRDAGKKVQQAATTTGAKINSSLQKASRYMDDSTITAKVKSALMDDKRIESGNISISVTKGVVTLTGFIPSQAVAATGCSSDNQD
ncbi:MAG: BON domain-containing protein [Candidatus Malihini olakiniferum]